MQATVRTFDPDTSSGTVLMDDGVEVPYDGQAVARATIRHLRIGQRVSVELAGTGSETHVSALWIYTVG